MTLSPLITYANSDMSFVSINRQRPAIRSADDRSLREIKHVKPVSLSPKTSKPRNKILNVFTFNQKNNFLEIRNSSGHKG